MDDRDPKTRPERGDDTVADLPATAGEVLDVATVLAAVAVRDAGGAGTACAVADSLGRADLELLGLVGCGPEPMAPSPRLRARLRAAIAAEGPGEPSG